MTVETDDPIVAMVYGALAYSSQRPALTTTTDLVAGQPGPWRLADEDQARLAMDLVTRLRSTPELGDPLAEAVAAKVLDAVRSTRTMLTRFWSDDLPPALRHEVEQLEGRMLTFTGALENWLPDQAATEPAPAPPADDAEPSPPTGLPTVEEATGWRPDQWIVLMRTHHVSQPTALAAVRADAEAQGLTAPAGLRDIEGNPAYTRLLLNVIEQASHLVADHG